MKKKLKVFLYNKFEMVSQSYWMGLGGFDSCLKTNSEEMRDHHVAFAYQTPANPLSLFLVLRENYPATSVELRSICLLLPPRL